MLEQVDQNRRPVIRSRHLIVPLACLIEKPKYREGSHWGFWRHCVEGGSGKRIRPGKRQHLGKIVMDRVLALRSGVLGLQSLPNVSQVGPIPTLTHRWDTCFYISCVTFPFLFLAMVL